METATIERTLSCDELPHHIQVNASNGAMVKVIFNTVNPAGKKTTVIMGRAGEREGVDRCGMTVAPDSSGFTVSGNESEYTLSGAVDEDEFTALLYWLNRYPNMVEIFREEAERLGNEYDALAAGHEPPAQLASLT